MTKDDEILNSWHRDELSSALFLRRLHFALDQGLLSGSIQSLGFRVLRVGLGFGELYLLGSGRGGPRVSVKQVREHTLRVTKNPVSQRPPCPPPGARLGVYEGERQSRVAYTSGE